MARYRRIVADDFTDSPRVLSEWRQCVKPDGDRCNMGGLKPGTALVPGPDRPASYEDRVHGGPTRTFAIAGANQAGVIYIANVNTLAGRGMFDSWGLIDAIEGILWNQGRALNVLVPTGVSVTKGMGLTTNALGWFVPVGAGERVIMIADENFSNNTGLYQHVRALPNGA